MTESKTEIAPAPAPKVKMTVRSANRKRRHWGLLMSFLIFVVLPIVSTFWYLSERAVEQFASTVGFTVRSEEVSSATDLLGGLGRTLSASTSSGDSDILYEFIRSQPLVERVDAKLDLRSIYSLHHNVDPIFGFDPDGTIEDLTEYWQRMVRISYDVGSGLMELRVLAFDPEDAQSVANAIFQESSEMINGLSAIAREDATRYAREDLNLAIDRLKAAREALTSYRIRNEIVDPEADIQGQMGLLNTLQVQLAEALIELDLLTTSTREGDPRIAQVQRRVDVIEERIKDERRKFGVSIGTDEQSISYATTIAEFERLAIEREFAEQAYGLALTNFDFARADANRQSRYLAAYVEATRAQSSKFPQVVLILFVVSSFSFLIWAIGALSFYAFRDRR